MRVKIECCGCVRFLRCFVFFFLKKPDSDEIITALQAVCFSAWADAREKQLRSFEEHRGRERERWMIQARERRDRRTLHSCWPMRAFICETWENGRRTVAQVCVTPISFHPNSAARRLPSLASLWSHLYPRPLCASSNALNFLSEAGV